MIFVSRIFLEIFLPLTVVLFYCLRIGNARLAALSLLGASFVFCSVNGLWQAAILACSILFNFGIGAALSRTPNDRTFVRRAVLILGIALDLTALGYFKYAGFFVANLDAAFGLRLTHPQVVLPVGISFYTFTQIAFLADVYAGRGPSRHSLSNYALFVTYFPHVIAGPIIHWRQMMPQFARLSAPGSKLLGSPEHREAICRGLTLFGIGLAKKIFIADQLAPFVDKGYAATGALGFADAWLLSLAYSFQLYYDFSGYCDMAIGASLLFGVQLPFNFDGPYRASSIQEFWRRWHITLSNWLRDYVFIPLGGSRGGTAKRLRNLFATFLLGGFWHGAAWTFVLWGALHGLAYSVHLLWQRIPYRLPAPAAVALTFLFVNAAWVFFRAPELGSALNVLSAMASPMRAGHALPPEAWLLIGLAGLPIWIAPTSQQLALETKIGISPLTASLVGACLLLAILACNTSAPSPFLYFNF